MANLPQRRRDSTMPPGLRRTASVVKRSSLVGGARRPSALASEPAAAIQTGTAGAPQAQSARSSITAAVSAAVASDKMIAPQPTEAARPKSGILLEKGANGMPSRQRASAIKNGRVSQVQGMQRASAITARRSSAVVSQNLGAILGKVNGAAGIAGDPAEAAAAGLMLEMPVASKAHSQAFFPELIVLTKAITERVSSLAALAGEARQASKRDSQARLQAGKACDAEFRQGVRRATWVGPAWMPEAYSQQAVDSGQKAGQQGAGGLQPRLQTHMSHPPELPDTPGQPATDELEESQDCDGVIGRDFLKHRAAKLLAAAARQREREHDSAAGAG
ncbi:hypothetical protein CVIRNUC_000757 [Coccomyxa viridis]|uniref:Uncharacterized protein n=1 Tax=Coccomyxa viridis TaxID=1274662 RepID=A0AAV1HUN3_9CHLO|nr:hypothetical protein CVIRNUC_000757 [Coccomyxa viridis]